MTMEKQVEVDSQSLTECSIDRMGSYTLYRVGVSDKWQQSLEN